MNKEFEYYLNNIRTIITSLTTEQIKKFYETYKDVCIFDDYLNINCENCEDCGGTICCINCTDLQGSDFCINCKSYWFIHNCENCINCCICDDCENCEDCNKCKHCSASHISFAL